MKLSDIKGERVYEVVAGIIDPLYNIADDKEAAALFGTERKPDGVTKEEFAEQRIRKGLPALIQRHKDDFTTILALCEGVSKEEYLESLTLSKFFSDVTDLITDPQVKGLFRSATPSTGTSASGGVQESTEATHR